MKKLLTFSILYTFLASAHAAPTQEALSALQKQVVRYVEQAHAAIKDNDLITADEHFDTLMHAIGQYEFDLEFLEIVRQQICTIENDFGRNTSIVIFVKTKRMLFEFRMADIEEAQPGYVPESAYWEQDPREYYAAAQKWETKYGFPCEWGI